MTDRTDPSLLNAAALSFVGVQVILLGTLFLSLGIILGINLVAQPAAADLASMAVDMPGAEVELPQYLVQAATITKVAAVSAVLSVGGLIYLDRQTT